MLLLLASPPFPPPAAAASGTYIDCRRRCALIIIPCFFWWTTAPYQLCFLPCLLVAVPRRSSSIIFRFLLSKLGPEVASNQTVATTLLSYHIIPSGASFSASLKDGQSLVHGLSARGSTVPPLKARFSCISSVFRARRSSSHCGFVLCSTASSPPRPIATGSPRRCLRYHRRCRL